MKDILTFDNSYPHHDKYDEESSNPISIDDIPEEWLLKKNILTEELNKGDK